MNFYLINFAQLIIQLDAAVESFKYSKHICLFRIPPTHLDLYKHHASDLQTHTMDILIHTKWLLESH